MKRAVFLFFLFVLISGCGNNAPDDAVVTAPKDNTRTISSTHSGVVFFRPLEFKVTKSTGTETIPVPDVDIRFFSRGPTVLSDLSRTPLSTTGQVNSTTNDRGIGEIAALITVPACSGPGDIKEVGSVLGTVGSASAEWTATITRTCATVAALVVATAALPSQPTGTAYNFTVTATGGTPPYNWSATNLPAGLTINASSGLISGTITSAAGTFNVDITVADSVGSTNTSTGIPLVVAP